MHVKVEAEEELGAVPEIPQPVGYSRQEDIMVFTAQRAQYGFQQRNSAIKSKLRQWKCNQAVHGQGSDWTVLKLM